MGLEPVALLPEPAPDIELPRSPKQQRHYQPDPLPAKKTLIIELYDEQGRLVKIHATTDCIEELVSAFYKGQ